MVKTVAASAPALLTTPAIVTLVSYAILAFMVLMPIPMYVYDEARRVQVEQPYQFGQRLLLCLLLCIPFALSVYSVNCMMVGNCLLWSWIVSMATVLWAMVVLFVTYKSQGFNVTDLAP